MKDFKNLKEKARQNPVAKAYLDSFSSQMGREIFKLRVNNKMTQTDLSSLSGVTQTTISRIEAGDPGIKGETYDKVLRALRTPKIELKPDREDNKTTEKDAENRLAYV